VKTDGSIACWGKNNEGQSTAAAGTFASVSAGKTHTCGVRTDGKIVCWGEDSAGQATPPRM
jgi:alpha-tubulin suppressor-like RCC1 family protein